MDDNIQDMKIDENPDKITIKVKLADEEYNDLVIDWSDESGPFKGQQVINQLSSITGIPLDYIRLVWISLSREYGVMMVNNTSPNEFVNKFSKENCAGEMQDGNCFAIGTQLDFFDEIEFTIFLYSRDLFIDNDCSSVYCYHSNTRSFLNRQIAIATNYELHNKLQLKLREIPFPEQRAGLEAFMEHGRRRMEIFRDFNIVHFTVLSSDELCRACNSPGILPTRTLQYSRARG